MGHIVSLGRRAETGDVTAAVPPEETVISPEVTSPHAAVTSEEWPDGLRCVDCGDPLDEGDSYHQRQIDDVTMIVCESCADAPDLDDVIALAARPLDLAPPAPGGDLIRDLTAAGRANEAKTLESALSAIGQAHARSLDAIGGALTASVQRGGERPDTLTLAALGVLNEFARRPAPAAPAAPDVHVHVPQHDLSVHVDAPEVKPQIDVHVPAQAPQPAPVVTVNVPEQPAPQITVAAAPAPEVRVEVPAAPAPVVNVTVPETKPRSIRVETDRDGNRRYVTE